MSNQVISMETAGRTPGRQPGARTRERLLFDALADDGQDRVKARALVQALERAGLRLDDPRLAETVKALQDRAVKQEQPQRLEYEDFVNVIRPSILTVERALKQDLVIPDFNGFTNELQRIYEKTKKNESGTVADYIPQLGRVDPERYGVAVSTIDGQRMTIGDAEWPFCLQSSSKPVLYAMALEEHGQDVVHQHIGWEPSGHSFNELALNPDGLPHNPMINAGAIMSTSLIRPGEAMADRFEHVLDTWRRLAGGVRPGFSNSTYLSERRSADRNFALGYFMRENGAFPADTDLLDTLDFYFQCCSLEVTVELLSVVAASLANGGLCPMTEERVFRPDTVQKVLSLMYSSGMYDFSGEWAFRVGLPAKSGVSGVILVVVPNVMGIAIWSPRLDQHGNSVRGVEFCRELVATYNFHNYDNLVGGLDGKKDPRRQPDQVRRNLVVDLCWAASEGDLRGIRRLLLEGVDLDDADYDGRTALHLAASEGQVSVVEYFIAQGAALEPVDRWGNTPAEDARRAGHEEVVRLLTQVSRKAASNE